MAKEPRGCVRQQLVWISCLLALTMGQKFLKSDVEILKAEPDYRSVKLQWRYRPFHREHGFKVTLCESQSWRIKYPCKQRLLRLNAPQKNSHDFITALSNWTYQASLYELRMLTNYTITVEPTSSNKDAPKPRYDIGEVESNSITVTTKGFSARTTRCLGNITDIEVVTGPYFAGKIEVEDKNDRRCSVYGDRRSGRQIYKLTILHDVCGSEIKNQSRIQTSIIVHENPELVTHSSRRFLVVCNFLPGTLTIQAAVQVPRNESSSSSTVSFKGQIADTNGNLDNTIERAKTSNLRHARLLQPEKEATPHKRIKQKGANEMGQAILPLLLTLAALIGVALLGWKHVWLRNKPRNKSDTISSLGHENIASVEVYTMDNDRNVTNANLNLTKD